jgi:transcriptional regulator with XRE-family HTH domain
MWYCLHACKVSRVQDTPWGDFASYLRDAMRAVGLDPDQLGSKAELARRADVHDSVLSRWLNNGAQPEIENLRKIAPVLRVRMLDLLVVGGHISPAEASLEGDPQTGRRPTAEEGILGDDDLTEREKRMMLAMLDQARERTGNAPAEPPQPAPERRQRKSTHDPELADEDIA